MNVTRKLLESKPDEWLIEGAMKGDADELDVLITRHRARAVRLAEFYLHDESQACAIAQKAFINTILSLEKLRTQAKFLAHLTRKIIALSAKSNFAATSDFAPYHLPTAKDTKLPDQIYAILADMPEDLRTVVTLKDVCGLSTEAIAKVLYLPEKLVADRVASARKAFAIHFSGKAAMSEED